MQTLLTMGINVIMLYFWFLSLFGGNLDFWSDFSGLPTQIVRGRSSRFFLHLSKQESQQLQNKSYIYRQPTKLWEGSVFSRMCLSVHRGSQFPVQGPAPL